MTREDAIRILDGLKPNTAIGYENETAYSIGQALTMAIQALENIGHLTDRPCSVCEFHKENGCCKWDCVFKGV